MIVRRLAGNFWSAFTAGLLVVLGGLASCERPLPVRSEPMPQQAYVWQRAWSPEVGESIRRATPWLDGFAVLAGEMRWQDDGVKVTRVRPDWRALAQSGRSVAAAIRIYPSFARTGWNEAAIGSVLELIAGIEKEAEAAGLSLAEIQLDYDCPESKLADYTRLVRAAKGRDPATPVVITALPTWLNQAAFRELAAESPNYVLQVHSLHLPGSKGGQVTLMGDDEARRSVAAAAGIGVPFRVALPTYSCVVELGADGKVVEVFAEDLPPAFNLQSRRHLALDADPFQMERLLGEWRRHASPLLRCIIWYRLPVAADRLNWPLPVLEKLCRNQPLKRGWSGEVRRAADGHCDVVLRNEGDAPDDLPRAVTLRWRNGDLASADGLRGYSVTPLGAGAVGFTLAHPGAHLRAAAGAERVAGWLRLEPPATAVEIVID